MIRHILLKRLNMRGQAVVELAVFGTLILLVVGTLLSYLQRGNDQQYTSMEAFRRALEKACSYKDGEGNNPGASVQYTLIQNRRHAELSDSYYKGNSQTISGSASVFWAVPEVNGEAKSEMYYGINEDEFNINTEAYTGNNTNQSLEIEGIDTGHDTIYYQTVNRGENSAAITNQVHSSLKDNINTVIRYKVNNEITNSSVSSGDLLNIVQGVYYDGGQYKYSVAARDSAVERDKTWVTPF